MVRITEEIDAMMDELCEFINDHEVDEIIRDRAQELSILGKHRKALNAMFEVDIFMMKGVILRDAVINAFLKHFLSKEKEKAAKKQKKHECCTCVKP